MRNADLLKGILVRLRTRPASTTFRRVKGHDKNYGNQRADALANEGREAEAVARPDRAEWLNEHSALPDGARLQALEASHMYYALLKWHTREVSPILHQERLEEAKDKVEEVTGLRPTNKTSGRRLANVLTLRRRHLAVGP